MNNLNKAKGKFCTWGRDKDSMYHLVRPGMLITEPQTYCGKPDSELKSFYFTYEPPNPCPTCLKGRLYKNADQSSHH